MSLPINGNQYFNRVENVASSQVQRILSDNVQTTNLTVSSEFTQGNTRSVTVVGYAATQGTTTWGVGLSTVKGVAPTVGNANGVALVLPSNAIIQKIVVQGPVAAGTSLTLVSSTVVAPGGAAPTGTATTYLNAGTLANINSGLVWTQYNAAGTSTVGSQVFVNTIEAGAFTTGANFTVTITYDIIVA